MCRQVDDGRHHSQIRQEVERRGDPVLWMAKSARPVHVEIRAPEEVDGDDNPALQGCVLPGPRIVADASHSPQQERWNHEVIKAQRTNHEGNCRVEHVFGTAESMLTRKQRHEIIERKKRLKDEQRNRLPGEDESAVKPEGECDQHIAKIAKVKEVLGAILRVIDGRPEQEPYGPGEF